MAQQVYLVGFMGSGKSTVGRLLARELGRAFHDLDELIEKEQNMSISSVFESKGESFFREIESHILVRTQAFRESVIALGGGTFVPEINRQFISRNGISVWIQIPLELARQRCEQIPSRPLANDPAQFESLFRLRERFYRLSDIWVDGGRGSPEQICSEITGKLRSVL